MFSSSFLRAARRADVNCNTAGRSRVPLKRISPDKTLTLLCMGQSNAANFGETPYTPLPGVLNLFNGKLYHASDPLLGARESGGSVWSRLGDLILETTGYETVILAIAAPGGTSISAWEEGDLLEMGLAHLRFLSQNGMQADAVLWHQGEADREMAPGEYGARLQALIARLRQKNEKLPFFVSVATRSRELVSPALQEVQRKAVNPADDVFAGPDTDTLTEDFRHDGVHFSDKGLRAVAEMWLESLSVMLR